MIHTQDVIAPWSVYIAATADCYVDAFAYQEAHADMYSCHSILISVATV